MSKQTLFNDQLESLIDACADYREAEQPDSGQGSWGRAMLYNQVLVQVRRVSELVAGGGVELDTPSGCRCMNGPSSITLAYPTTCLVCGGVVNE